MRRHYYAIKLVTAGLLITTVSLSVAQTAGGGTPVWTKVLDTPYGIVKYTSTLSASIELNTEAYHRFPEHYKVWETMNEDTTLTAPWTSPFSAILDWPNVLSNPVKSKSDANGLIIWIAKWEDCLDQGTPAVERWLHNPTNKKQERKNGYKVIEQVSGGAGA